MPNNYNSSEIEKKWQDIWEKSGINKADQSHKDNYYCLDMFPYPSGSGLHVGHWRGYVLSDVAARVKKIEGYNVLHPMGWDAFGLPAENDAIKKGIHPRIGTDQNIANIRSQLKQIGACYDWDKEVDTTDPNFYKWTQWMFLQMYKMGLAYQKEMPINWCPSCKTGLANEEVVGGVCERCGAETTKKNLRQWVLKITAYADRLLEDLDKLDWPEKVKKMQSDWIGRSNGSSIKFKVKSLNSPSTSSGRFQSTEIEVFTTRADTLFGCTYVVLAPESEYILNFKDQILNLEEVEKYIEESKKKSNIDRMSDEKDKTGVKLEGVTAINPINNKEVEVWIADYVIADYGTGAVMAVPAHDERDFAFAKKYGIEIIQSIAPNVIDHRNPPVEGKKLVERRNVHAIVKDPKTGKYLALKWKKYDWTTFPMGGVEDGEDLVEAAKREVEEETGFNKLKLIKVLDGQVRAEYFAAHKDVNRASYTNAVMFELVDDSRSEVSEEEKEQHEVIWLDEDKLNYDNMTHAEIGHWQEKIKNDQVAFTDYGYLVNSDEFSGLTSEEGKKKITEKLKKEGLGDFVINYKLRDWLFSRQRYWGEPIPIIHCEKCGAQPVDEKDLPILLPEIEKYEPTGTGESPLANVPEWFNTTCPKCGGSAKRETNTMPQWAGSCWYFIAYALSPDLLRSKDSSFINNEFQAAIKKWMPVDLYVGGIEHAVLHLLYSRFWTKVLFDLKAVEFDEPFARLFNQGMVYLHGAKMSKSKGNVVSPDEIIEKYGTDALRAYELFMAPPELDAEWNNSGVPGTYRFLKKVWDLGEEIAPRIENADPQKLLTESFEIGETELEVATHKTIKKFNEALEGFRYNTLVSTLMEFTNLLQSKKDLLYNYPQPYLVLILLLSPICPHITEEIWQKFGFKDSIFSGKYFWPKHDPEKIKEDFASIVVQENGKLRGNILIPADAEEKEVIDIIKENEKLRSLLDNHKKIIYVKNRLLNIVR